MFLEILFEMTRNTNIVMDIIRRYYRIRERVILDERLVLTRKWYLIASQHSGVTHGFSGAQQLATEQWQPRSSKSTSQAPH